VAEKKNPQDDLADRDLYSGLIRLHVLHHAAEEPIFGLGMIEELARHGYRISAGSLYPLLHGLEKKGYLRSIEERNGKSLRKVYRATRAARCRCKRPRARSASCFAKWSRANKFLLGPYLRSVGTSLN
jgi:PadR family transcriptional regulator PadR